MGLAFKWEPLWSAKRKPSLLDFCVNPHKMWTICCPYACNCKAPVGKAYSLAVFLKEGEREADWSPGRHLN